MNNNAKIITIIPARKLSKSIPNKNIKLLGNKPLIAYPIDLAKSVDAIDRVIVSTDSKKIAQISKQYGAEAPFIRPAELAQDDTPTLPVLQHCISYLEENEKYMTEIIAQLVNMLGRKGEPEEEVPEEVAETKTEDEDLPF